MPTKAERPPAELAPAPPRGRWVLWLVAISVLLVLAVLALALLRGKTGTASVAAKLERGERVSAPALPAGSIDGSGETVQISGYARDNQQPYRRLTVVNFWASWCGPCREEMPYLTAIGRAYSSDQVLVVGINIDDRPEDALAFAEEFAVDYPLVRAERSTRRQWGLRGQPETFVVDEDGGVALHVPGPIEDGTLRPALDELLAGRAAS